MLQEAAQLDWKLTSMEGIQALAQELAKWSKEELIGIHIAKTIQ